LISCHYIRAARQAVGHTNSIVLKCVGHCENGRSAVGDIIITQEFNFMFQRQTENRQQRSMNKLTPFNSEACDTQGLISYRIMMSQRKYRNAHCYIQLDEYLLHAGIPSHLGGI